MIDNQVRDILVKSEEWGWVLEPDAKQIMNLAGLEIPRSFCARTAEEACDFAHEIGYPVVAKLVSPSVLHKSDVHGVEVGIDNDEKLITVFVRFRDAEQFHGMLVEEMIYGIEIIIGAKIDYQFGPMILLGMGGTGVEIYRDTSLRMAPLAEHDVTAMIQGLTGHRLLEGYRGAEPVNFEKLTRTLIRFSNLVMRLEAKIDSIDLNPVLCSSERCVIADARIVLKKNYPTL
jgi:succinyl-CoA synthetase beta subunit